MTPALVARLIEGARAGSLALTRTEAIALVREITPGAAVIVDGRPVDLRSLPWHVFPDHVAELPELDPWRRMAHESLVEGLIDAEDQRRLFEVAERREAEHRRQAEEIAGRFTIAPRRRVPTRVESPTSTALPGTGRRTRPSGRQPPRDPGHRHPRVDVRGLGASGP